MGGFGCQNKISKCQQSGISIICYIFLITSTIMKRRTTLWRSLMVLRVKKGKGHFFDKLITSQILLTSTMMSSYMWWRSWADSVKVWESRSWYRDQWSAALFRAVELSTTQILLFLPPAKRMVLLLGNDLYYSKLELGCKEDGPVQQSFANDSDHTSSLQRGRSNMTIL